MADLPGVQPDQGTGVAGGGGGMDPGMGFGNVGGNSWLQGLLALMAAQNPNMGGMLDKAGIAPPAGLTAGLASAGSGGGKVDLGSLIPAGGAPQAAGLSQAGTQPYAPPSGSGADGGAQTERLASSDTGPGIPAGAAKPAGDPLAAQDAKDDAEEDAKDAAAGPQGPAGQMTPAQLMALAGATGTAIPKPVQPITSTGVQGGHVPYPGQGRAAAASAPALNALISALIPGGLGAQINPLRVPTLGSLLPGRR